MKKSNLFSGVILLALATAILIEANKLGLGSLKTPESGLFSFMLAIVLAILSLVLLRQAIKEKDERRSPLLAEATNWKKIGMTLGALLAYAFLLEPIGYLVSSFFLIVFLLLAVEAQKWWLTIVVAFLSSAGSYLIFDLLLNVPLPVGMLGI